MKFLALHVKFRTLRLFDYVSKVWQCRIAAEVLLTSKLIVFRTSGLASAYSYSFNF